MSQLPTNKSRGRDAPPALFLRPSPAASTVSIPGVVGGAVATGALQQAVTVPGSSGQRGALLPSGIANAASTLTSPLDQRRVSALRHDSLPPLQLRRGESTRATDRTDALWAEMQATLEEVELSASGGTRVFGPDHDRKLGELRTAQIALAQVWARSEADEAVETTAASTAGEVRSLKVPAEGAADASKQDGGTHGAGGTESGAAGAPAGLRPGSSGLGAGVAAQQEKLGAKLEEETEVDIRLARQRREANDRYFQRVNQGVIDVVAKLEEVAIAMRAVEQESKDIWAENESVPGSAKS